jgi:hypothetical protein
MNDTIVIVLLVINRPEDDHVMVEAVYRKSVEYNKISFVSGN